MADNLPTSNEAEASVPSQTTNSGSQTSFLDVVTGLDTTALSSILTTQARENRTSQATRPSFGAGLENLLDSQASFIRAAGALETTFARVRTLRAALESVRTRMAPPDHSTTSAVSSTSRSQMGPDHYAIVLSAPELERLQNDPTSIATLHDLSPPLRSRSNAERLGTPDPSLDPDGGITRALEEVNELQRRVESGEPFNLDPFPVHPRPSRLSTFRFGPRPEPSQTQSQSQSRPAAIVLESYVRSSRERDLADSFTTTGRRVAAREAGPSTVTRMAERTSPDLAQRIMEIATNLQRDIRLIAEHNEHMNALVSRARSTSVPPGAQANRTGPLESTGHENVGRVPVSVHSNTVESGWRSVSPQLPRMRMSTGGRRPSRLTTSSRPATSGVQSTTVDATGRDSWTMSQLYQSADTLPVDNTSRTSDTSYRVRRFYNADGEEQVHNITLDDSEDDDPYSWLLPSQRDDIRGEFRRATRVRREQTRGPFGGPVFNSVEPALGTTYAERRRNERSERVHQNVSQSMSGSLPTSRHRRRGWARIDTDGNEVPTDEEEEYERNRSQMRVRALQLLSGQVPQRTDRPPPQVPEPPSSRRRPSFVPTTQTLLWPTPIDSHVRVRMPLTDAASVVDIQRQFTPRDETEYEFANAEPLSTSQHIGSAVVFTPSPLPIPCVDLSMTYSQRRDVATSVGPIEVQSPAFGAGR
ncbi:uncharacterized protein FIBRA_03350 [Fibroporia radiculosa]|uniref:Uncharacterized protein n=1 Tax=Fibroporia radiculosa TaxID=599839 RepID=J4I9K1_9APHY|nr:uncharacterized protein FIBRA_03350 [Fibroporia radiculosa]CCM01301.1 predicted protein [Fibroporia radiculosa]